MDLTVNTENPRPEATHDRGVDSLACPVCSKSLRQENHTLLCPRGHAFDLSAKGYVNLLLSQDKNSQDPGDNRDMVLARRRFLEKGYYKPLADGLASGVKSLLESSVPREAIAHVLDAGCGEGYYTGSIQKSLEAHDKRISMIGMDISREAVKAAATRYKSIFFAVASLFRLPVADRSQDLLLNCFAPACDSEFRRVLADSGRLMMVIPGKNHLYAFKSLLYSAPTHNDEKAPGLPSFVLESKTVVQGTIQIEDNQTLQDLLTMTPYYWRTPAEGIQRLKECRVLTTEIEFLIMVFIKK